MLSRSMLCSLRGIRQFSSSSIKSNLVNTTRCGKNNNVLRIAMNSGPVNSLSMDLMIDLRKAIKEATDDKDCAGIIIASSCRTFSAGLNMKELHGATPEHLGNFWKELQDLMYLLYGANQAVIAEIGGHAPAAGTILALCCDSRVAAPGIIIGLNESAFGLNVPKFGVTLMQDTIGKQAAYRAISQGTLYKSEDAVGLGLVDMVVDSSKIQDEALKECEKWIAIPGRPGNKFNLREETLFRFISERQADIDSFVSNLTEPITQERLGNYLASLSKKK